MRILIAEDDKQFSTRLMKFCKLEQIGAVAAENGLSAKRLLEELKDYDGKVSKQWKARANRHQAAIDRGDPFETARVYKSLSKLESQDGLRAQDKAHLAQSLQLLTEELSCCLRKSPEQTRKLLADVAS